MRRVLSVKATLAVALVCAMLCTACSTAWVSSLDAILGAAAPALINILQIVAVANGQPVNGTLAAKINGKRNAVAHRGEFCDEKEATEVIEQSKKFVLDLIGLYEPNFILAEKC